MALADTAYLIAMYRALETDRPDALFQDPLARRLAGYQGEVAAQVIGSKRQATDAIAVRTFVLDELITHLLRLERVDTVLNLAAGLDTRPYRLLLPPSLQWVEVDMAELLVYKEQTLRHTQPACSIERVAVDLADDAVRNKLFSRINATADGVIVLTEGLLGYWLEEQVASLATDLHRYSKFCWWLSDLAPPTVLRLTKQSWNQKVFEQYFGDGTAAVKFAPENGASFFTAYGWQVLEFRSLWKETRRLNRDIRFSGMWEILMKVFARRYWQTLSQQSGIVLLKRTT